MSEHTERQTSYGGASSAGKLTLVDRRSYAAETPKPTNAAPYVLSFVIKESADTAESDIVDIGKVVASMSQYRAGGGV